MDLKIIFIYCLCDDVLNLLAVKDNPQCRMCTAEIMTVGVVAALFHGGNIQASRQFLKLCNYMPNMLSHSRLHRRLMAIPTEIWEAIFAILKNTLGTLFSTKISSSI